MPYIAPGERHDIDEAARDLAETVLSGGSWTGRLNYALTRTCVHVLKQVGVRYRSLSAVGGVLADVRDELYRRVIAPHENAKLAANGDVYEELRDA